MKKIKKTKEKDIEIPLLDGLAQSFKDKSKKQVQLKTILKDTDWWILKKRTSQLTIVSHDGVKKIADAAGIQTNPRYSILISPTHENNYTLAMQVEICDGDGRCTVEIGEVNRNNLGSRGRANPVNMAQKRAYDRAVFRHLGINGLLGEDEIQDVEEEKEMDKINLEEQKQIVPLINKVLNTKTVQELKTLAIEIKKESTKYTSAQVDVLRGLWKKRFAELTKSF